MPLAIVIGENMRGHAKHSAGLFLLPLRYLLSFWHAWFGVLAWAPCRPSRRACEVRAFRNRDIFVIAAIIIEIIILANWETHSRLLRAMMGGFVIHRLWDLSLMLVTLALFGTPDPDAPLGRFSRPRIQRVLVLILVNYFELIFLFSVLYLWLGAHETSQFHEIVASQRQAFVVSMSTISTVGYGTYAPEGTLAIVLTTVQAFLGLLIVVFVLASFINISARTSYASTGPLITVLGPGCKRATCHVVPVLVLLLFMGATWAFLE